MFYTIWEARDIFRHFGGKAGAVRMGPGLKPGSQAQGQISGWLDVSRPAHVFNVQGIFKDQSGT